MDCHENERTIVACKGREASHHGIVSAPMAWQACGAIHEIWHTWSKKLQHGGSFYVSFLILACSYTVFPLLGFAYFIFM